jgi:hypothetical protein
MQDVGNGRTGSVDRTAPPARTGGVRRESAVVEVDSRNITSIDCTAIRISGIPRDGAVGDADNRRTKIAPPLAFCARNPGKSLEEAEFPERLLLVMLTVEAVA